MKVKHEREKELIKHYNNHPKYWTFSMKGGFILSIVNRMNINIGEYKNILDVGCGRGLLAKIFTKKGLIYEGVDFSDVRIKMAKKLNLKNTNFYLDDIYSFLESAIKSKKKYDLITMFEVLEHLEEPELVLDMCKKILSDKGVILGSVPHNMPNKAHLQVYKDENDVKSRLNPVKIFREGKQYFCRWN